jgi:hypothetical protein
VNANTEKPSLVILRVTTNMLVFVFG